MKSIYYIGCLVLTLSLFSCGDDDEVPTVPNQPELITTLEFNVVDSDGNITAMIFQDLDGDGANEPTITGGTLKKEVNYTGTLTLLNESATPTEVITAEIQEEATDHQFFFSSDFNVPFVYNDFDENGKPLGLITIFTFPESGEGTLKITLRHKPTKSGENVEQGDITNAGGETDIEVNFPIIVE